MFPAPSMTLAVTFVSYEGQCRSSTTCEPSVCVREYMQGKLWWGDTYLAPYIESVAVQSLNASSPSKNTSCSVVSDTSSSSSSPPYTSVSRSPSKSSSSATMLWRRLAQTSPYQVGICPVCPEILLLPPCVRCCRNSANANTFWRKTIPDIPMEIKLIYVPRGAAHSRERFGSGLSIMSCCLTAIGFVSLHGIVQSL